MATKKTAAKTKETEKAAKKGAGRAPGSAAKNKGGRPRAPKIGEEQFREAFRGEAVTFAQLIERTGATKYAVRKAIVDMGVKIKHIGSRRERTYRLAS